MHVTQRYIERILHIGTSTRINALIVFCPSTFSQRLVLKAQEPSMNRSRLRLKHMSLQHKLLASCLTQLYHLYHES